MMCVMLAKSNCKPSNGKLPSNAVQRVAADQCRLKQRPQLLTAGAKQVPLTKVVLAGGTGTWQAI